MKSASKFFGATAANKAVFGASDNIDVGLVCKLEVGYTIVRRKIGSGENCAARTGGLLGAGVSDAHGGAKLAFAGIEIASGNEIDEAVGKIGGKRGKQSEKFGRLVGNWREKNESLIN